MKYFKMVGFYFFELLGSLVNCVASFFGIYPSLDLGVRFLLVTEGLRIRSEKQARLDLRQKKEVEAKGLQKKAGDG